MMSRAIFEAVVLGYFALLNLTYFLFILHGLWGLMRYGRRLQVADRAPADYRPISILLPARNEAAVIVDSVSALLGLGFPEFEVIVINDGSTDETLPRLQEAFELVPMDPVVRTDLATRPVRQAWRSLSHPNLVILDKEAGGKGDALNAGILYAGYPLVCTIDADCILDGNALERLVKPFVEDDRTVAVGGIVRVLNGCSVAGGRIGAVRLPERPIEVFQVLEYTRAFLSGRTAMSLLGCLLLTSGAFSLFRREAILAVGGFATDTMGEDMEMTIRLHRYFQTRGEPYRILFVPDPVCWTQVPADLPSLLRQRHRWQRGLWESLVRHRAMLFKPTFGRVGLIGMPYFFLFEALGPLVEMAGYLSVPVFALTGTLSPEFAVAFFTLSVLVSALLSIATVLLDDFLFRRYENVKDILRLVGFSFIEWLGYRQFLAIERTVATFRFGQGAWGQPERRSLAAGSDPGRFRGVGRSA